MNSKRPKRERSTIDQAIASFVQCCFIVAAILLSGCGKIDPINADAITYCSEGNPAFFNPQLDTSSTTADASAHQIYDRLLEFNPVNGRIEPGLADSWIVSDDGLSYTFQLRRNVAFHSTDYFSPSRSFNADDVIFSINRWRVPTHPYHKVNGGNYPYFDSLGLKHTIKDIDRINGYRIQITYSNLTVLFWLT